MLCGVLKRHTPVRQSFHVATVFSLLTIKLAIRLHLRQKAMISARFNQQNPSSEQS
jgi:hypothetical protein